MDHRDEADQGQEQARLALLGCPLCALQVLTLPLALVWCGLPEHTSTREDSDLMTTTITNLTGGVEGARSHISTKPSRVASYFPPQGRGWSSAPSPLKT
jgi:hypothetical protein